MPRSLTPYIPQDIGELQDYLAFVMLDSPAFIDKSGYFPERNVETVFFSLNEGLFACRAKLGQQRYETMRALSDAMRAHFEADPDDLNGRTAAGQKLVLEMIEMLKRRR